MVVAVGSSIHLVKEGPRGNDPHPKLGILTNGYTSRKTPLCMASLPLFSERRDSERPGGGARSALSRVSARARRVLVVECIKVNFAPVPAQKRFQSNYSSKVG